MQVYLPILVGQNVLLVTGDTKISEEPYFYFDTSCRTRNLFSQDGNTCFSVGAAVGDNYKVTYTESTSIVMVYSTAAETWLETKMGGSLDLTLGTESRSSGSGNSPKNLFYVISTTVRYSKVITKQYNMDFLMVLLMMILYQNCKSKQFPVWEKQVIYV